MVDLLCVEWACGVLRSSEVFGMFLRSCGLLRLLCACARSLHYKSRRECDHEGSHVLLFAPHCLPLLALASLRRAARSSAEQPAASACLHPERPSSCHFNLGESTLSPSLSKILRPAVLSKSRLSALAPPPLSCPGSFCSLYRQKRERELLEHPGLVPCRCCLVRPILRRS